ncbi:MAG: hypothetical protein KF763_15650 [Cyclobacteriaceae bacterium]|nr:hypothetical protein [Cyclobacteriaceae bacterium]
MLNIGSNVIRYVFCVCRCLSIALTLVQQNKATVHFKNGDTQDIDFTDEVNAANDGRLWDLKGNSRAIEKITFWYDSKNDSKDKSVVEVWGK